MLELIHFKRTQRDTSTNNAMYQITFECDRKGVDDLLELMRTEQAVEVHKHMVDTDFKLTKAGDDND